MIRTARGASRVPALAFLATLVGPGHAVGQASANPNGAWYAPVCDAGHAVPVDTVVATLVLRPTGPSQRKELSDGERAQAQYVADVLAGFFRPSASISLPQPLAWDRQPQRREWAGPLAVVDARFRISLADDGRRIGLQWRFPSESPQLNAALEAAVRAADSAGALAGTADRPGALVELLLAGVDSVRPDDTPLTRLRLAYYPVEQPVEPRTIPAPRYPAELQFRAVPGRVEVRYIIGPHGRVIPGTLRVLSATHPAFAESAREVLLRASFAPARGSGCAVPAVVEQAISFKIGS